MSFNIISVDNNNLKLSGRHFSVLERSDLTSESGMYLKYKNGLNIAIKSGTTNTIEINTGLMKNQGVIAENDTLIEVVPTPSSINLSCRLIFTFDLSSKEVSYYILYNNTSNLINTSDLTLGSPTAISDVVVATFNLSSVGITNLINVLPKFDVAGKKQNEFAVLANLTLFQGSSLESQNFKNYKNMQMITIISGVKHIVYDGIIPNKNQIESYPSQNWSTGNIIIVSPDMISIGLIMRMDTDTKMTLAAFRIMKHNGTGLLNHSSLIPVSSGATNYPINIITFYN